MPVANFAGIAIARQAAMPKRATDRIVVELDAASSQRQHRELGAFVRFCVFRLEREFGELRWFVRIGAMRTGYGCLVAVTIGRHIVEARGSGFDGVFAAWDALSNTEQGLREAQIGRTLEETDHLVGVKASAGES